MICFTYNLHLAVMSAETEPGPNLNSLKFKALRTIRDLFYPTLELRIVGLSLVFLSLAISAETPEDIIYQFAPGVVVVLCIVFSTWLEMFSNYVTRYGITTQRIFRPTLRDDAGTVGYHCSDTECLT